MSHDSCSFLNIHSLTRRTLYSSSGFSVPSRDCPTVWEPGSLAHVAPHNPFRLHWLLFMLPFSTSVWKDWVYKSTAQLFYFSTEINKTDIWKAYWASCLTKDVSMLWNVAKTLLFTPLHAWYVSVGHLIIRNPPSLILLFFLAHSSLLF